MKKDKVNSNSNEQTIKSNCSIIEILNRQPCTLPDGKCVCYSATETDKDTGINIEHKIRSAVPLTQYDIELLDFLLEHVEKDGTIHITGADLFDRFGRDGTVFDSLHIIELLELMDKISASKTRKTAYHRFRVIASMDYEGESIKDNTEITIKLYDRFVARFIDHAIPDCQISIDYVALGQKGLIGEMAKEFVDDARAKLEQENAERSAEENEDEADDDSDYEDDQTEDQDEDQEDADNQESGITVTLDDSQPILLSIRQLNRIYSSIPEEDYEIKYGVLLKYRGKGGDIGIPSQVNTIGKGAFEGCSGLLSISIPETVKHIGVAAFKDCANLVEVDIPLHLLRVVMGDIGAYFGGTQFVEYLAQDGALWRRHEEVRKAMEAEEAEKEEEGKESEEDDKDGDKGGDKGGDKEENGKEEGDNGGGATNEPI